MILAARKQAAGRPGAVVFWVLICLSVLIGVVALSLDGGRMMDERRHAQVAADAAALSAAIELYNNYNADQGTDPQNVARNAALQSAVSNGYGNDGQSSVVTVNVPPTAGAFKDQPGYA